MKHTINGKQYREISLDAFYKNPDESIGLPYKERPLDLMPKNPRAIPKKKAELARAYIKAGHSTYKVSKLLNLSQSTISKYANKTEEEMVELYG